jgi:hypothetical protein
MPKNYRDQVINELYWAFNTFGEKNPRNDWQALQRGRRSSRKKRKRNFDDLSVA